MRIQDGKKKYSNNAEAWKLSEMIKEMTGLKRTHANHMMYLQYASMIHNIACKALDSEIKLTEVSIEIPWVGKLTLSINGDDVSFSSFDLEEDIKTDVAQAVRSGKSPLIEAANDKLIEVINERFKELV